MAIKFPDKAKGIPYDNTEYKNPNTNTLYTSADVTHPYDVFMDYDRNTIVFGYSSNIHNNETKRDLARSIITYIQNDPPYDPEVGELWICPSATSASNVPCKVRLFRTSFTWECWGVNPGYHTFQLDAFDNIEPTVSAWDKPISAALFVEHPSIPGAITTAHVSAGILTNNLFETSGSGVDYDIYPKKVS